MGPDGFLDKYKNLDPTNSKDFMKLKQLLRQQNNKKVMVDVNPNVQTEGSLHKWFKGSKSKDGKGGWVNVVTGGTCASDEPGEGTPKCVSSAKRASMTKAERLSAARRKKKADPNQQQKSGAAKPTYVSTDKPKKKKMKESYTRSLTPLTEKAKKCWPGYEKKGTKKMFGKTYNNCVKKEEVEMEAVNAAQQAA